jgi:hypothetical protein
MKNKIKFIVGAIIGGILPFFAVSCNKNDILADSSRVEAIAGVLKAGTQISVSIAVASKPEARKYFETAVVAIDVALGGKDLAPETVSSIIKSHVAVVDNLGQYGGIVEGGIGLALGAYKTFYQINIEKSIQPYLVTLLKGIQEGIREGVKSNVSAPQGTNPISALTKEDLTL